MEQIVASRRYQPARARGELRASVGWKAVPLLNFYLGDDAEKKGDESRGTKAAVMLLSVPTAREKTQSEGIVTTDDTSASLIQPSFRRLASESRWATTRCEYFCECVCG